MRRYLPEELNGERVANWSRVAVRRSLVGKKIEWHSGGYLTKNTGVVQEVKGKNVLVDSDWHWAPQMHNVHVVEE